MFVMLLQLIVCCLRVCAASLCMATVARIASSLQFAGQHQAQDQARLPTEETGEIANTNGESLRALAPCIACAACIACGGTGRAASLTLASSLSIAVARSSSNGGISSTAGISTRNCENLRSAEGLCSAKKAADLLADAGGEAEALPLRLPLLLPLCNRRRWAPTVPATDSTVRGVVMVAASSTMESGVMRPRGRTTCMRDGGCSIAGAVAAGDGGPCSCVRAAVEAAGTLLLRL
jgi:hypothetical protein